MVTKAKATPRGTASSRKPPESRDREATRERILAAVGRLVARDGFSGLGVNAVAREAGADKVLIYRYFGGIEGLLEAWGRSVGFGGPPAAGEAVPADPGEQAATRVAAYARSVRANPEALEVMRWALVEDNALTRRLASLLEEEGLSSLRAVRLPAQDSAALDLPALAAVLSAGLLHLALRARTAPEWLGVPLRTGKGWARLERAAATLARGALQRSGRPGPAREEGVP
jgi:AcrR family transcriptional regulator